MPQSQVLIYGCGSIGLRHAQLAQNLGANVIGISSQKKLPFAVVNSIKEVDKKQAFDLAIIATPTYLHAKHLQELSELAVEKILIEKPLFSSMKDMLCLPTVENDKKIFVAYNLRFHPALCALIKLLENKKLLAMQIHVGQYLPSWRPTQDYAKSYSAKKDLGGGVLRDLSHELDLACFFAGPWKRIVALGGKVSNLNINSEDCISILAEHEHCSQVTIHLDYLQTPPRRDIVFVCENFSIRVDLITGEIDCENLKSQFVVDRNTTYNAQMKALLYDDGQHVCSYEQGIAIVKYIEAIEQSIKENSWIWNESQ